MLHTISSIGSALGLALVLDWKLALGVSVFAPFSLLMGKLHVKSIGDASGKSHEALIAAGKVEIINLLCLWPITLDVFICMTLCVSLAEFDPGTGSSRVKSW